MAATVGALVVCLPVLGQGDSPPLTLLLGLPLVIVIGKLLGLYDRDELVMRKSTLDEAPGLFQASTLFCLLFWIGEAPLQLGDLGGDQVLVTWIVLFLALLGGRLLARAIARRTTAPERCLLLGDAAMCEQARAKIEGSTVIHVEVVGEIASARIGEEEVPVSKLAELADLQDVQRVIIAPRSTDHGDVLNLVRAVKSLGLNVSVLPRLLEVVGSSVVVDDLEGLRVLGVRRFGLTRSSGYLKRAFDIVGAGLGLLSILPLLTLIAVAVKLDSRGPALFRQQRIGKDGRSFRMVKFRTMVADAEAKQADLMDLNEALGLFKIEDDPRITRVGRLLRRASLDELPQLLNVLRGEMSLVGPRPLVLEDDSRISGWDRRRLHLVPGMTGPWQVLGSARIPLPEMVKLDYLYVATWSLWGDIKILLRTSAFVLRRRGL
ncbi:MAG: exopolysaccharide biosynthesis polyprenyl glycosylphosphotransferase [Actinomycetota bacterium]|nr:exopolysaccharide biosynthesis polyprenyl glycosylphosphotransferase [Actinomycetota bacterium]